MSHVHNWIRTPHGFRCSLGVCSASPDEKWWSRHCGYIGIDSGLPCGAPAEWKSADSDRVWCRHHRYPTHVPIEESDE